MFACECIETKDGPVIWEDHFYQIIDPETGEVLPDGAEGELVFTSLTKEAFPVIRYRTRDLTRLLPPTSRAFRRIGKLTGRSDDMLIIRGVNVFPTQIEEQILRDQRLAGNYQVVVTRDGHGQPRSALRGSTRTLRQAFSSRHPGYCQGLQHRIKTIIGVSTKITVMEFDAIPRTQVGKAKRVLDERQSRTEDKEMNEAFICDAIRTPLAAMVAHSPTSVPTTWRRPAQSLDRT